MGRCAAPVGGASWGGSFGGGDRFSALSGEGSAAFGYPR